ncbi:MAG: hypothetical protein ACD_56C00119G0006 [uncultured bacterium]|nr:MAG: hypothetical protein ACD_56C00119G0006 [uncultured bacterium]
MSYLAAKIHRSGSMKPKEEFMQLYRIRMILGKTCKGANIKSFNMCSGERITSPEFILKEITLDGLLVFLQKGCRGEGKGDVEIVTEPEMIESITYFPPK